MREYSPKRRTAVVLAGTGTSGAYHAGALKALDESGVKVDLVVGSGVGAVCAAFAAPAGSARLYGPGGFWEGVRWGSLYRLRAALRAPLALLGASSAVFLLPLAMAVLAGLFFPAVFLVDLVRPGTGARLLGGLGSMLAALREPYLAALAAPVFVLCVAALVAALRLLLRERRRLAESFEALLDASRAEARLRRALWEIARGAALSGAPRSDAELGKRYVALAAENLGQPGFRELILRTADLETGTALPFVLLQEAHRTAFAAARSRGALSRVEGIPSAVDLGAAGYEALLLDAVLTGLLPPLAAPPRRVAFPKSGLHGGETHRLADATLAAGCGVAEALAAGAEQVIVVSGAPEAPGGFPRRRGPLALAGALLAGLERQGVDEDVKAAERINRMVETLGHSTPDDGRAWQDPATGRIYRSFALYVIRPERRLLGPLDWDGARDPSTEVVHTPADLMDLGYRDAYRLFVEPVVGAAPEPQRQGVEREEGQPVEL